MRNVQRALDFLLNWPATRHSPVVPWSAVHRWIARLADQILAELGTALVDADGVADHEGRGLGGIGELGALHPGVFESRDGVDRVEEADEADSADRPGESISKCYEVLKSAKKTETWKHG